MGVFEIHNEDGREGFQNDSRIEVTRKTVFSEDGKQYIEGEWQENNLTKLLSCQFNTRFTDEKTFYIRNQTPEYLFIIDHEDFIARVKISDTTGLYVKNSFLDNRIICELLFNKIKITEIFKDGLMNKKKHCYKDFISLISDICHKIGYDIAVNDDILQIYIEIGNINEEDVLLKNDLIMNKLVENKYVSEEIKDIARTFLNILQSIEKRNDTLPNIEIAEIEDFNLTEEVTKIIGEGLEHHKRTLHDNCFIFFDNYNFKDLSAEQLLFITKNDMKMMSDLASVSDNKCFSKILNLFQALFIEKVESATKYVSYRKMAPMFNSVTYYIFKSFTELIETISSITKTSVEDTLNIIQTNSTINWESPCSLDLSMERQCRFLFQLITFFSKGSYYEYTYEYTFKFLTSKNVLSKRNVTHENLRKLLNLKVSLRIFNVEFASIPEDRRIWLYLLDDAMSIEGNDCCFENFQPVLSDFVNYISKSDSSLEVFRIFTHNLIQFIVNGERCLSYFRNLDVSESL
ncbi:uncharacterized protein LOC143921147 [Arctopsyche grandis]|uniref:uncharacterized protein LOC143921141 n=1 Tax=Arctopsyche grandis TaxID=121162 RepID=UPI00406D9269